MKNTKPLLRIFAAALFCLCSNLSFAQSKMYIPLFETINLKKDFQIMAPKLLKSYLEDNARYKVILPLAGDSQSGSWEEFEVIRKRAQELNAQFFTLGTLTRLGENVIVDVKMYETSTGNKTWNDKLKAVGPDDLDPIMQKIAAAIGTANKATTDGDIYNVTNYESKELKKKEANFSLGASIGGIVFMNNIPGQRMAGYSLVGSYDTRQLILDLRGSYNFGEQASFYNFSLEVLKPLREKSNTAFFGGGMFIGGTTVDGTSYDSWGYPYTQSVSTSGLGLMAGGGYIFNRTSSVQLRLSGNIIQTFYTVAGTSPTGVIVKMEILFRR